MGPGEWLQALAQPEGKLKERLIEVFGNEETLIKSRLAQYRDVLKDGANYIMVNSDKVSSTELTQLKKLLKENI